MPLSADRDELQRRLGELTDDAYADGAPWQLRQVALPLALDLWRAMDEETPLEGRAVPSDWDREHVGRIVAGEGSWFSAHVLRLCNRADRYNLAAIRHVYPEHVEAYEAWRDGPGDDD